MNLRAFRTPMIDRSFDEVNPSVLRNSTVNLGGTCACWISLMISLRCLVDCMYELGTAIFPPQSDIVDLESYQIHWTLPGIRRYERKHTHVRGPKATNRRSLGRLSLRGGAGLPATKCLSELGKLSQRCLEV